MIDMGNVIYRACRSVKVRFLNSIAQFYSHAIMKVNRVHFGQGFVSKGIPQLFIHKNAVFEIGTNFKINNTIASNPIGRGYWCIFRVNKFALLSIGDNVGMSGTTIVCNKEIVISDNVKIGGNTCIYDTDFHSLDYEDRLETKTDSEHTKSKKIFIGKNVFIGAHVTILKGVSIGENSIVGAASVVTKDIPDNEIWAGNPARSIRKINEDK